MLSPPVTKPMGDFVVEESNLGSCPFAKLNAASLGRILSFCSFQDVFASAQVCRQLAKVSSLDSIWMPIIIECLAVSQDEQRALAGRARVPAPRAALRTALRGRPPCALCAGALWYTCAALPGVPASAPAKLRCPCRAARRATAAAAAHATAAGPSGVGTGACFPLPRLVVAGFSAARSSYNRGENSFTDAPGYSGARLALETEFQVEWRSVRALSARALAGVHLLVLDTWSASALTPDEQDALRAFLSPAHAGTAIINVFGQWSQDGDLSRSLGEVLRIQPQGVLPYLAREFRRRPGWEDTRPLRAAYAPPPPPPPAVTGARAEEAPSMTSEATPSRDGANCPGSHGLTEFSTPADGWYCSGCLEKTGRRKGVPAGTAFYGCRACEFDLCTECRGPVPGAPASSGAAAAAAAWRGPHWPLVRGPFGRVDHFSNRVQTSCKISDPDVQRQYIPLSYLPKGRLVRESQEATLADFLAARRAQVDVDAQRNAAGGPWDDLRESQGRDFLLSFLPRTATLFRSPLPGHEGGSGEGRPPPPPPATELEGNGHKPNNFKGREAAAPCGQVLVCTNTHWLADRRMWNGGMFPHPTEDPSNGRAAGEEGGGGGEDPRWAGRALLLNLAASALAVAPGVGGEGAPPPPPPPR